MPDDVHGDDEEVGDDQGCTDHDRRPRDDGHTRTASARDDGAASSSASGDDRAARDDRASAAAGADADHDSAAASLTGESVVGSHDVFDRSIQTERGQRPRS